MKIKESENTSTSIEGSFLFLVSFFCNAAASTALPLRSSFGVIGGGGVQGLEDGPPPIFLGVCRPDCVVGISRLGN
jgi:hypothetical protein